MASVVNEKHIKSGSARAHANGNVAVFTPCGTTAMRRAVMECFDKAIHLWHLCQVELKGDYSVERLLALDAYSFATSPRRIVFVLFGTIVPCLLPIVLLESFPLAPIEDGIEHSHNFWYRTTIGTYMVTHSIVTQFGYGIPDLGLSTKQTIIISATTTVLLLPMLIGMNLVIGFPMPFFVALSLVVWCPIAFTISWIVLRERLRHHPQAVPAFKKHTVIFNAQSLLIVVYPAYTYFFSINTNSQTWLALLLPVLKLILKNLFGFVSQHLQDAKPELVVFNVEIFSALYVSSCTRSATSWTTTIVIMAVDFIQACLSIKDLYDVLDDPRLQNALGDLPNPTHKMIPLTMLILLRNRQVYDDPSIRHKSLTPESADIVRTATQQCIAETAVPTRGRTIAPASETIRVQPLPNAFVSEARSLVPATGTVHNLKALFMQQRIKATPNADELQRVVGHLSEQEQLFIVQKTLRILHIAEFIALVEYAEVFVPIVYSLFCIIAYSFPNGKFYTTFAGQSGPQLLHSLQSVMLYGSLELVSLVALEYVMRCKFHVSAFRQTAFVLETQWAMVQSKLTLWMLVVLQFALPHYGFDFSFQFKWLKRG